MDNEQLTGRLVPTFYHGGAMPHPGEGVRQIGGGQGSMVALGSLVTAVGIRRSGEETYGLVSRMEMFSSRLTTSPVVNQHHTDFPPSICRLTNTTVGGWAWAPLCIR